MPFRVPSTAPASRSGNAERFQNGGTGFKRSAFRSRTLLRLLLRRLTPRRALSLGDLLLFGRPSGLEFEKQSGTLLGR
jgi:hypothetical protein